MKVYYKKHKKQEYEVIAVCDEDILGKSIGNQKISEYFYNGQLIDITSAIEILRTAKNFNIAGKSIVNACVETGIITLQGIITLDNIPFALKFLL